MCVKYLAWKPGRVNFLTNLMSVFHIFYFDLASISHASRRPKSSNWREHALAAAQICFSEIDQIYSVTCDSAAVLRIIVKCQWLWKMDNSILYIHAIWNRPSVFFFLENKRDCDGNLVTEHDMDICGWVRHSRHDTARASKSSWHSWDCKEIQKYTNWDMKNKTRLNAYYKHERGHEGSQPDILRIEGCIQHISAILVFLTTTEIQVYVLCTNSNRQ